MTDVPKQVRGRMIPVRFRENDQRFTIMPIFVRTDHGSTRNGASINPVNKRPRLLLLDDNPIFLRALGRLLETHSFHVDMEGCHEAAFDRFSGNGSFYDLALVDVHLKGSSGWDFAKKVSRLPDAPPILLMSGEALSMTRDAPKNVKGILAKPFSVKRLKEEIENWGSSV